MVQKRLRKMLLLEFESNKFFLVRKITSGPNFKPSIYSSQLPRRKMTHTEFVVSPGTAKQL